MFAPPPSGRRASIEALRTDGQLIVLDAGLVVAAHVFALVLRFDGRVPVDYWSRIPGFVLLAAVVYVAVLAHLGLYGRVWVQAGAAEAWQLLCAGVAAAVVLLVVTLASGIASDERVVPLSVPLTGGAFALLLLSGVRFRARVLAARVARAAVDEVGASARVVLVGRVADTRAVIEQMRAQPRVGLHPVAVVTDEAVAWRRSLGGIPVIGPVERVVAVAEQHVAQQLVLVPDGDDREDAARVADLARGAGLRVRILPTLDDDVEEKPRLKDIRDLRIEDLLGREPVELADPELRAIIGGRRVLVTGAGGSIGSEIAVQAAALEPERLVLLDHDETHLHDAVQRLGTACLPVLGDIRDEAFVMDLFAIERPEVVFHAAAHKHVPILESFPSEAVRTNVMGTDCLVRAAVRHGVPRFVAISTDKAVDPVSVMGASKRMAEQLLLLRRPEGARYCAVRFGNVLGSRGSVVPTFLRQIESGGPVTVTHPDMERFFMTTREAVHLVLHAAAGSRGGEVFTLDMGRPVRIVDLADRIITLAGMRTGRDIAIEFTGLRPGEKLTEVLHAGDESVRPTAHPKISQVTGVLLPGELLLHGVQHLAEAADRRDEHEVRRLLLGLSRARVEIDLDAPRLRLQPPQPAGRPA